ncbi:MAG TPA: chemotaxis protein CheA [Roseiarcus sp.]|nr:chemotaxis protein CheA [Roseiarcus sp.]
MSTPADPADIFRQEASDLLEGLEQALLDLEGDPGNRDLVNTAFRALHTIKGSGAMFGFDEVAAFAHEFESAFDRVRRGETAATPALIAIALNAQDFLRTQIESPDSASAVIGLCILADLRKLTQSAPAALDAGAKPAEAAMSQDAQKVYDISLRFKRDVLVNGANPLRLIDELRGLGEARVTPDVAAIPALDGLDPLACLMSWRVRLTTRAPRRAIEDVFMFVADDMELGIEDAAQAQGKAVAPEPPAPAHEADAGGVKRIAKESATIRVQAERLDSMMDRVGELVIAQARLTQLSAAGAATLGVAEEIERLTSSLRETIMGIRMLPIGSLFGRFRRLVHDLSRDLGKEIDLVTVGEETELDKTMIERLADPLIHVIRNAADHGLEPPQQRRDAGKPTLGTIRLVARHAGAEVLISVTDDGRGLDVKRIRAKAEENGIVAPGAPMSESELHQLIFHPGFSTAKEVSALSGRGVGMDVVRRAIEGMRGAIEVATEPGHGSTLTLRLPLTLAIIEGLLVRVGATHYVIPLTAVEECVELAAEVDERSKGRSFLNIRGDLVPFIRLREIFCEPGRPEPHQKVVIVNQSDSRVGFVVDQILGNHQTVIKSLSKLHADVPSFSGATILGDGAVALILDTPHLIAAGQTRERRGGLKPLEAA